MYRGGGARMGLKVAIQMDPIELIDIDADSTFRIAEARRRRWAIRQAGNV